MIKYLGTAAMAVVIALLISTVMNNYVLFTG